LLLDHLFSATFERGTENNLPVAFYNFALLYCWITGRARNVKVPKVKYAIDEEKLKKDVSSIFKSEDQVKQEIDAVKK
jgi:wyosine [tRNA(Phe)-imidazoG37] synthetase (radical SAM superfamily)